MIPDLLTTQEAALAARCHVVTIRKALASGELHGQQRRGRGRWLIKRNCLEAWLAGRRCVHESGV